VPQTGEALIAGRRPWTIAAVVFAVAASAIALATLHQFGATWDEEHSMRQGDLVLRWYASAFTDRRVIDEGNFRFYGGFFNVLVQLVHRTGASLYGASHALTLLFALASLPLTYWIGATTFSPAAGFFAMVLLWLTPVYYGHSFNNPKDIPFAVMSLASLAAIMSCWDHLPRPPMRVWLRTAVVIGLTIAIRVGGLVLFGYLGLSWLAWLAIRGGDTWPARVRSTVRLAITGAQIFVVAWLLMCVFWPWAQDSPVHGPWRGLLAARRFTDFTAFVRFQGLDILSDRLPRTYAPIIFGITLPEFYFLIAALAPFAALRTWRPALAGPAAIDRRSLVFIALLVVATFFPVASAIQSRTILYDGIRHLLFIVPPLAVLAGIVTASFFSNVPWRSAGAAVAIALGASVAVTIVDMWRLHPYESIYFNRAFGGGLPHAYGRFETDYWGQSYREATDWVVANYAPAKPEPIRLANCSVPFLTEYYLDTPERRGRFRNVHLDEHPEIVLATTRWHCNEIVAGRVLHVVTRLDTPLCYVIEVDPARYVPPANMGQ
jgi:hypothetical protein